jgi:hypothetical protein
MKISEVISLAQNGELKQLAIRTNKEALMQYIFLGMIALYEQFNLKTKEVIINLEEGKTEYKLPEDCFRIEAIYNEDGEEYILNNEDDALSILQPSFDTIQVPNPEDGAAISIIYSAYPTPITSEEQVLELPLTLLDALLNYVAYKACISPDSKQQANSTIFYQKYQLNCEEAKKNGALTRDFTTNYKLTDRGFA